MSALGDIVQKVRSKNAGPFWLTIDIFCGSDAAYKDVVARLDNTAVAALLGANSQDLKRFDIASLNVVKISLPRPTVQGAINDRDMHGASWAALLSEMDI
tara:strand:+ start:3211 stop:3510 length:300 start_codon:yes stop_codon:yes gene_type:complete